MNTMEMKQKLKTMCPKSENWARKVVDGHLYLIKMQNHLSVIYF